MNVSGLRAKAGDKIQAGFGNRAVTITMRDSGLIH